jgi:hypothetical protein
MYSLTTIKFTAEVDVVGSMHFLKEDDRNTPFAGNIDYPPDSIGAVIEPGHCWDTGFLYGQTTTVLHIDNNENGLTDNQIFHSATSLARGDYS